jgi:hypothetical protein
MMWRLCCSKTGRLGPHATRRVLQFMVLSGECRILPAVESVAKGGWACRRCVLKVKDPGEPLRMVRGMVRPLRNCLRWGDQEASFPFPVPVCHAGNPRDDGVGSSGLCLTVAQDKAAEELEAANRAGRRKISGRERVVFGPGKNGSPGAGKKRNSQVKSPDLARRISAGKDV